MISGGYPEKRQDISQTSWSLPVFLDVSGEEIAAGYDTAGKLERQTPQNPAATFPRLSPIYALKGHLDCANLYV